MSFPVLPQSCAEESLSSWIKRQKGIIWANFISGTLCTGEKTRNYSTTRGFQAVAPDQGMRNEEVGFQMQKEEELPEDMSQRRPDQSPGNKQTPRTHI